MIYHHLPHTTFDKFPLKKEKTKTKTCCITLMQLYELYTHFKLWMGMAETEIISKPFHKQKDTSKKRKYSFVEEKVSQLFQKTNKKTLGLPVLRQRCKNNAKRKGGALLPPLQQAFSYSFFHKKGLTSSLPWALSSCMSPQHPTPKRTGKVLSHFIGSSTTKASLACSLPRLLQYNILGISVRVLVVGSH